MEIVPLIKRKSRRIFNFIGLPHHYKLNNTSAMDKIQEICKKGALILIDFSKNGKQILENGDFDKFEKELQCILNDLHDDICGNLINEVMESPCFEKKCWN